jgi:hypothetical protein
MIKNKLDSSGVISDRDLFTIQSKIGFTANTRAEYNQKLLACAREIADMVFYRARKPTIPEKLIDRSCGDAIYVRAWNECVDAFLDGTGKPPEPKPRGRVEIEINWSPPMDGLPTDPVKDYGGYCYRAREDGKVIFSGTSRGKDLDAAKKRAVSVAIEKGFVDIVLTVKSPS